MEGTTATTRPTSSSRTTNTTKPPSRPTTPLRPTSRTSLRDSQGATGKSNNDYFSSDFPLETLEPGFAELADSMADLEANMMHLQLMDESLARFNENFAAFLYGLNMNAFCVDFPEAPILDSFKRAARSEEVSSLSLDTEKTRQDGEGETTFMTADTSFVSNIPPSSSRQPPKSTTSAPKPRPSSGLKRGSGARGGTATRGSGLARAKPKGAR